MVMISMVIPIPLSDTNSHEHLAINALSAFNIITIPVLFLNLQTTFLDKLIETQTAEMILCV